jgi:hypothetical protein
MASPVNLNSCVEACHGGKKHLTISPNGGTLFRKHVIKVVHGNRGSFAVELAKSMTCSTKSPFYSAVNIDDGISVHGPFKKRYRVRSGKGLAIPVCCLFLAA